MRTISPQWKKTKDIYFNWLINTGLRKLFAKNLYYENLSLWWLTKVYEKDALNNPEWFCQLNNIFNKKKETNNYFHSNLFLQFIKIFLKLLKTITLLIFIKCFYRDKNYKTLPSDCFYVYFSNLTKFKNNFIDRQYGSISLKNKKICYAVQLPYDFSLIFNFFTNKKKLNGIPVNFYIVNNYLKLTSILKVFYETLKNFLYLNRELNKKNYFIIGTKDCSKILKPLLIESFFGTIQFSLLNGISFRNLNNYKKFKTFTSYLEFFPSSRSIYYFLKKEKNLKLISINHANFSENMLAYCLDKREFSNKNDFLNFSPSPDIFFTQGSKYFYKLKKIFPNKKIKQIGSLKLGIQSVKIKNKNNSKRKLINTSKKIISIFTSTHDYLGMTEILNNCNMTNYFLILRPHPDYRLKTINHFKKDTKFKFNLLNDLSSREIVSISDFVLSGDSSLCYEAAILGKKNTLRLYNEKFHPLFDLDDGITIVKNSKVLDKYLNNKIKIQNLRPKSLIKKFFFKYDKKAHIRFNNILKKI
jgi:hypothetical protein